MLPTLVLEGEGASDRWPTGLEIIELGSVRAPRHGGGMGQLGDVFGFIAGLLKEAIDLLATIVGTPLDLIGQGASWLIDGLAGLIGEIPIVGELVAQILTAGKVVLNAGLQLPGQVLGAFSNLLGSFTKLPEGQQKTLTEGAVGKIIEFARGQGREKEVRSALSQNPPTVAGEPVRPAARAMSETPGLARAAVGIGLPAAGAVIAAVA